LAFNLLDPSKPHFCYFDTAAWNIQNLLPLFSKLDIFPEDQFWNVYWNAPSKNTDANILISLLQLDHSYELAKRFLEKISMQELLQTQLDFNIDVYLDQDWSEYNLEGSIIEVFAQLAGPWRLYPFKLLLELGAGFFDPSIVLLLFVASHDHEHCKDYCLLSQLLQLGATSNVWGYMVTPLQIAVASQDFEGVKVLLKAGADPNGTGDSGGIEWIKGSPLDRFNHLHDVSPLRICREFERIYFGCGKMTDEAPTKIDAILLQYRAVSN
jgi:hypothetical protein